MSESQFEVTATALDKISQFFQGRKVKPIRIHMNDGFCVSSGLSLTIEEPEEGEVLFEVGGFKYYIEEEILEKVAPIKVDFTATGFKIHSKMDIGPKCPGCGEEGAWCSS